MEMDFSSGQMVEFTTEVSKVARKTAKVYISGRTDRCTMEISEMITALVSVFSTIQMERGLKEHGEMVKSMEKGFMFGLPELNTTAFILMETKRIKEASIIHKSLLMSSNRAMVTSKRKLKQRNKL